MVARTTRAVTVSQDTGAWGVRRAAAAAPQTRSGRPGIGTHGRALDCDALTPDQDGMGGLWNLPGRLMRLRGWMISPQHDREAEATDSRAGSPLGQRRLRPPPPWRSPSAPQRSEPGKW